MEYCNAAAVQAHHVRSISLPSSAHPMISKVDEELLKLRNTFAGLSQPVVSSQIMCNLLKSLGDIYGCLENFPSFQQSLLLPIQKQWVEEELDFSLILLDACSGLRDLLAKMKELAQDLEYALRRRKEPSITRQAHEYFDALDKVQKDMKKCLRLTKQGGCRDPLHLDKNTFMPLHARVSTEARGLTMVVLHHILSFCMLKSKVKGSKLPPLSKAMQNRKVACNKVEEEQAEIVSFDALYELITIKDLDDDRLCKAQLQLERIEFSVDGLESGIECLLKRLIQNRVCLLNVMSLQ